MKIPIGHEYGAMRHAAWLVSQAEYQITNFEMAFKLGFDTCAELARKDDEESGDQETVHEDQKDLG